MSIGFYLPNVIVNSSKQEFLHLLSKKKKKKELFVVEAYLANNKEAPLSSDPLVLSDRAA